MEQIIRKFKRFLKDEGIYHRALGIYTKNKNKSFVNKLSDNKNVCSWIQDSYLFCHWAGTPEGELFWWLKSIYWQYCCITNNFVGEGIDYDTPQFVLGQIHTLLHTYHKVKEKDLKRLKSISKQLKNIKKVKYGK